MIPANGFDIIETPDEWEPEWRATLLELRELRHASLAEIGTLREMGEDSAITSLIERHSLHVAELSQKIEELLTSVRTGEIA